MEDALVIWPPPGEFYCTDLAMAEKEFNHRVKENPQKLYWLASYDAVKNWFGVVLTIVGPPTIIKRHVPKEETIEAY